MANLVLGDLVVEARGVQSSHCAAHFEESVTLSDGSFSILGLSQNCIYSISMKSKDFLISPSSTQIAIKDHDITDIEFSAFKGNFL